MNINVIILRTIGILLSSVAAYFSVLGLMEIFSGSKNAVMGMAITLEIAKVVAAYNAHLYWNVLPKNVKAYLVSAIVILMGITSLGIFGFLSKAHIDQTYNISTVYETQIKKIESSIDTKNVQIADIDKEIKVIDDVIADASSKGYVTKALQLNKKYESEKTDLLKRKNAIEQEKLELEQEKINIQGEQQKSEIKVGPIKYIVGIFNDDPSNNTLNYTVKWLIIILVVVFDPFAIVLLIASSYVATTAATKPSLKINKDVKVISK